MLRCLRSRQAAHAALPARFADLRHHQKGALGRAGGAAGRQHPVEFLLEGGDQIEAIDLGSVKGLGRQHDPG